MLIIVEGCDGVGKTTFAEKIQEATGGELRHYGPPTRPALREYTEDLDDYGPGEHHHVICDRYHWGELIYGPLYRGKSELFPHALKTVQDHLISRGAVVAFLWNDLDTLAKRHKLTGEDYLKPEDVMNVHDHYELIARNSPLPVMRFKDPVRSHVHDVITLAKTYEQNAYEWRRDTRE